LDLLPISTTPHDAVSALDNHNKTPPTDREANTIRNLIFSVVGNVANIDSLYSYLAARPCPRRLLSSSATCSENK